MNASPDDWMALERVVARTKHERFRELLDPRHPDHNPAYWDVIRQLDGQPAPPAESDAERRARKPRMPLGQPQRPDPDCVTCNEPPPGGPTDG